MRLMYGLLAVLVAQDAFAAQYISRQYGVSTSINFELFDIDGVDKKVDAVHAAGDTVVMLDNGVPGNTTSGFVDEGTDYSIALTAVEMTAARIVLTVVDQATKAWLDQTIVIETFGDLNAQDKTRGVASGVAQSGTATTIVLAAATNIAADFLNNHVIQLTAGTGAGQSNLITGWSADTATVAEPWTTTPSSDTQYIVLPSHQGYIACDVNGVCNSNVEQVDASETKATNLGNTFENPVFVR